MLSCYLLKPARAGVLALLCLVASATVVLAQKPLRVDYFPQDYNAYELNWAFVQDAQGRLFVGNNEGVLVFDGLRWQLIATPTPVRALGLSPQGTVIVGCKNDFGYLKQSPQGAMRFLSFRAELPEGALGTFEYVLGIYPNGDATLVVTRETVFRLVQETGQANKLQKLLSGQELIAASVFRDRVVVVAASGEHRIIQGGKIYKGTMPGFPADEVIMAAAPLGKTGNYLVATESNRIYRYGRSGVAPAATSFGDYLNTHTLYALAASPNGKWVAVATQTGGVILADEQLQEVARLDGNYLPSPDIYALSFDNQGGLWVAHAKGLSRLATDRDARLLADESQLGGKVLALAADTRGLWVGTTQGLFLVEQGNVRNISEIRGQEVWSLHALTAGGTLVGTTGGLWLADAGGSVKALPVRRAIYALTDMGGGRVAYGGDRVVGLLNCGDGNCTTEWQDTTQTIEVSSLAPDDKSGLWVGTSVQGTLHRLANGKWEKSSTGVSASGFSMVTSVGGKVWRFDQSGIHNLSEDKAATLATYLPQGAQYLYGAQEIWASAGGRAPLRLVPDADNLWDLLMPNPLAVLGKAPTAVAELSKAYFAGKQGSVYRLGTTTDAPVIKAYLHRLIDVSADTILSQFPFEEDIIAVDYASRNIALEIGLSDLGNPAAVWVQHKLANGNWSTLKSGGRIELGDLSIGNNTVKIRVMDSYGRLLEIDEFKIRLKAPWYLTIWGILLFVVVLVALVFLVVRLYVRRLEKQKIQLERIVAERTEEVKKQAATIQEQNKEMLDSIRYAQRIQDVMLPSPDFLSMFFEESFLLFRPHSIVSGDFYWYYLNNEHLWLAAADCTGHGVPGAMMSSIGINQLNVIVRQNPNTSTYDILNQLDAGIRNALKQDAGGSQMDGMDIALCKINLNTGKVEFTGANRPLYVLRGQEILIFEADRTAIGGTDVSAFSSQEIVLQPADRIFMFTDGYPDQMGKLTKRKLGIKRMRTLLEETHALSLAQQLQRLEQEMKEWQQDEDQTDDMLVMAWQVPA